MVRKGKEKKELKNRKIFAFLFPPFFSSLNKHPKIPNVRRICLLNWKFFLLIYLFIFVFAPFLYLFSFPSSSLPPFILLCTAAMIAHLSVSLSLALCLILFFLLSPLFISFLFPFFLFFSFLFLFCPSSSCSSCHVCCRSKIPAVAIEVSLLQAAKNLFDAPFCLSPSCFFPTLF